MGAMLPWRPFRELSRWDRDFARQLREMFEDWPFKSGESEGNMPALESFVRNGQLVVRADLPGMEAKDVDISVLGNVLTIKGERRDKKEVKEHEFIRREVSYGAFERRMTLPAGVDAGKIEAQCKDGVLEVTMPVGKELQSKKVTVKPGK
jgi:HSP20 family protein